MKKNIYCYYNKRQKCVALVFIFGNYYLVTRAGNPLNELFVELNLKPDKDYILDTRDDDGAFGIWIE